LWSGISPGDMSYDNHVGHVSCSQAQDVSWDGNEMTIKYNGNKNTCYAHTRTVQELIGTVPNHGKISAMIKITNNGCNADTIWPAFWLVASEHGSWPGCGEIDIAERQRGSTQTHLIGAGGSPFSGDNMVTYGNWPAGQALYPDGQYREYGFEWNFRNQEVDFTVWLDGVSMGTHTCGSSGGSGQALTCSINFNAVKQGFHFITFDVDTHGSGSDHYSMSVKDLKIEQMSSLSGNSSSVFVV